MTIGDNCLLRFDNSPFVPRYVAPRDLQLQNPIFCDARAKEWKVLKNSLNQN